MVDVGDNAEVANVFHVGSFSRKALLRPRVGVHEAAGCYATLGVTSACRAGSFAQTKPVAMATGSRKASMASAGIRRLILNGSPAFLAGRPRVRPIGLANFPLRLGSR